MKKLACLGLLFVTVGLSHAMEQDEPLIKKRKIEASNPKTDKYKNQYEFLIKLINKSDEDIEVGTIVVDNHDIVIKNQQSIKPQESRFVAYTKDMYITNGIIKTTKTLNKGKNSSKSFIVYCDEDKKLKYRELINSEGELFVLLAAYINEDKSYFESKRYYSYIKKIGRDDFVLVYNPTLHYQGYGYGTPEFRYIKQEDIPSLKDMCLAYVAYHKLDTSTLPNELKEQVHEINIIINHG